MTTQTIVTRKALDRSVLYWTATVLVAAELVVGGWWDITRYPQARDTIVHLGYPTYFLVLLGVWKLLGALALLVPGFPLVKEWAYAGVVFVDSGGIVSHLTIGYARGEVTVLALLLVLTVVSWATRPAGRKVRDQLIGFRRNLP
ncbi:DoxX family protein [Nocardia sp. NPDC004860]|uniref:DoxX family protein n=1 Tax=Nocardia sp. NPDC004860 TaxID=3154557 RepID=UPI0033A384BE